MHCDKSELQVIGLWIVLLLGITSVTWLCFGCAMVLDESHPPTVRYLIVPTALDATYTRAQKAAASMGGVMLDEDAQARTFTAKVHGAIALHVAVERVAEGTQITVAGSVLPKMVFVGVLTEVDEFVAAYRRA